MSPNGFADAELMDAVRVERTLRRTLGWALVLVALSTVFLDYWEYSRSFHQEPDIWASTLRGATAAPAQYRIGVLKTADALVRLTGGRAALRHMLALIDVVSLLVAMFVLWSLLLGSQVWQRSSVALRWFGAALFVGLLQYALGWLTWYQRPETLAIAMLLALSLWCATRRVLGSVALTAVCTVLLAMAQGWTRADVGFTFHFGVALAAAAGWGAEEPALGRWLQAGVSLLAAGVAAGTQVFIMRVVYPHASYGDTPMFQLLLNWSDHIRVVPFVLFMAPAAWLAWQVGKRRVEGSGAQAGLLIGAAMFTGMWVVLGKIDEVRIFLPWSFALAPLLCEAAMEGVERMGGVGVSTSREVASS